MKNRRFQRLVSALCTLALVLTLAPAARAAGAPAKSKNVNAHTHTQSTSHPTIKSHLYDNGHGLTRVEYLSPQGQGIGSIIVEEYSDAFQLQSSRTIPFELSKWGGFFAGESYNFFIFGQDNTGESDSVETIRVVKYDKSWNRLGHYSLYGGNIQKPFAFATVRCAEYGGYLYIHTGRTMYKDSGGVNHQANVTLHIRESDMSRISYIDREISAGGYVSHSFDQYILVDAERNVVTLDLGDGYPRALAVIRYDAAKAGPDPLKGRGGYWGDGTGGDRSWHDVPNVSRVWDIPGQIGNNNVHSCLGDFAETSTGYLTAFCRDDAGTGFATRKLYMGYTTKSGLQSSWNLVSPEHNLSAPYLASTGLGGGWLLWNSMEGSNGFYPGSTLQYAAYSADGSLGEIQTAKNAPLSDCEPIQYNGRTVWYTTEDSAPTFYSLDASGVTATPANGSPAPSDAPKNPPAPAGPVSFTDVPASHWAYDDIAQCVALGAVSGYPDGGFRPGDTITIPELAAMLERVFYPEKLKEYQESPEYAGKSWYVPVCFLAESTVFTGIGLEISRDRSSDFQNVAKMKASRFQMAAMVNSIYAEEKGWLEQKEYEYLKSQITDYSPVREEGNLWPGFELNVFACMHAGILTGMPDGSFSGEETVTRAQACAVINRLYNAVNP